MADPADIDVSTGHFDLFFEDEDHRRHILELIQETLSYDACDAEAELSLAERIEWQNRLINKLLELTNMYHVPGNLPELRMINCHEENNVPNVGILNQAFNAGHGNNAAMMQLMANLGYHPPEPAPVNIPNSGEVLHLPANATNALTSENIKEGNILVDFGDEYGEDRFHLKSSFDKWKTLPSGHKENPYTRAAIENARTFRATFAAPPLEGGKRTRRRRGLKKRRTMRRK